MPYDVHQSGIASTNSMSLGLDQLFIYPMAGKGSAGEADKTFLLFIQRKLFLYINKI